MKYIGVGNSFINHGWQCPVCGYIYSPSTPVCYNCNRPDHEKYKTTTGTQLEKEDFTETNKEKEE